MLSGAVRDGHGRSSFSEFFALSRPACAQKNLPPWLDSSNARQGRDCRLPQPPALQKKALRPALAGIARQAGVAQGIMSVHFKNKEALFTAMIAEKHSQGTGNARKSLDAPPPVWQGFWAFWNTASAMWVFLWIIASGQKSWRLRRGIQPSDACRRVVQKPAGVHPDTVTRYGYQARTAVSIKSATRHR